MLTHTYYGLGTVINLSVAAPANETDIEAGYELIRKFEKKLTVNREYSEVVAINNAAGKHAVMVSKSTYELIKLAVHASQLQMGFNVALGPLVKLWGIGFNDAQLPEAADIKKLLHVLSPTKIKLDDATQSVFLLEPQMQLDLGGIAKGYIADAVGILWRLRGVQQGIIDLGGNLLLVGEGPHLGRWHIGIQDPLRKRNIPIGRLTVHAGAVVTAGIYERVLKAHGKEYHHIFNAQTGYPVTNGLSSVTLVSPHSVDGDLWTTLAFCQGATRGRRLIEDQPELEGVFIQQNGEVTLTSGLKESYRVFNY